jgi:hypothetical protein
VSQPGGYAKRVFEFVITVSPSVSEKCSLRISVVAATMYGEAAEFEITSQLAVKGC